MTSCRHLVTRGAVATSSIEPFDTFDRLTPVLLGRLIAFGIGTMVTAVRALNLGPTSEIAKTAEQAMAIAALFIAGVGGGVVLFLILRTTRRRHGLTLGLTLGVVLGVPTMIISLHASATASVGPVSGAVWVVGAFLVWRAILDRAEQRLLGMPTDDAVADTAVERIDRRRFLVKLGGTTAVVTVGGAVVGS